MEKLQDFLIDMKKDMDVKFTSIENRITESEDKITSKITRKNLSIILFEAINKEVGTMCARSENQERRLRFE